MLGISSGLLIGAAVFIKTSESLICYSRIGIPCIFLCRVLVYVPCFCLIEIVRKACDYAVGSFAVLSFTSW